MNLIEHWKSKSFDRNAILKELHFLLNETKNWEDLFCCDENGRIRYCVPYNGENACGKETGICYSEEAALEAIKFMLNEYGYLLVSWIIQGENEIEFWVDVNKPIAYTIDKNKVQEEIFSAMFVFRKCANKSGFCVQNVVPILGRKEDKND